MYRVQYTSRPRTNAKCRSYYTVNLVLKIRVKYHEICHPNVINKYIGYL